MIRVFGGVGGFCFRVLIWNGFGSVVRAFFFAGFFAGFRSFLREIVKWIYLSVPKGTRTGKNTFLLKPTNWLVELWWNFGGTLVEL